MKLANALSERAHLNIRLAELDKRLKNNAKVQDGQSPAEDPQALLAETDEVLTTLEQLMARINLVNSRTTKDGVTLTELLARRDCLTHRLKIMRGFLLEASGKVDRYSKSEIIVKSTVPVAELQKEVDIYARELRRLDEAIQELNWSTEF